MSEDYFKTLKIVAIIAVLIGIIAAITYFIYGFGLFWATFAAGITIGLLMIIIIALLILSIYFWVRTFLLKREIKNYKNKLEYLEIELARCKSELNRKRIHKSQEE